MGWLFQEQTATIKAQQQHLQSDVAVTVGSVGECAFTRDKSVVLLLSPVGKPLPHPTTREEVKNLFDLLWQLHKNGLIHGNPRVENVICLLQEDNQLLWIGLTDLMDLMDATPSFKGTDAEILTRSILKVSWTVSLGTTLSKLIDDYAKQGTRDNLDRLAKDTSIVAWHRKKVCILWSNKYYQYW